jgi:hypothetical protein
MAGAQKPYQAVQLGETVPGVVVNPRGHFRNAGCNCGGCETAWFQQGWKCEGFSNVSDPAPERLRIGSERHNYVYRRLSNDLFECDRGSDWAMAGYVLFLYTCGRTWFAADAPQGSDTIEKVLLSGIVVFATDENPLQEGFHIWRTNYNYYHDMIPDWRQTGLSCKTTFL